MSDIKKIWGLYCPPIFEPQNLENLSEIDVWKAIDNIGAILFWDLHDRNKPWRQPGMTAEQRIDAQYALEYLVYYTRKFGVEFSKMPTEEEHVEKSETYEYWYSFWSNHFKSMTKEEYQRFIEDKISGKDITEYLPEKTWQQSYLELQNETHLVKKHQK